MCIVRHYAYGKKMSVYASFAPDFYSACAYCRLNLVLILCYLWCSIRSKWSESLLSEFLAFLTGVDLSLASRSDFLRELTGVVLGVDLAASLTGVDCFLTEDTTLAPILEVRDFLDSDCFLTGVGESFLPLFFSCNGETVCFSSLGTDEVSTVVLCFLITFPFSSAGFSLDSATNLPKSFNPRRPVFSSAVFGESFIFLNSAFGVGLKFGFCTVFALVLSWRPESANSFLYFSDCSIVSLISSSTSARGRE